MRLDTWTPQEEKELDEIVERLTPDPDPPELIRSMAELRHKKRFLDRQKAEQKVEQGLCGYCERPTAREYCGSTCEKSAAFTSIGGALKFHGDKDEK